MAQGQIRQLWQAALVNLQLMVTPANFESYLKKITVVESSSNQDGTTSLILGCPSVFHLSEIKRRNLSQIESVLSRISGGKFKVELVVSSVVLEKKYLTDTPLFQSDTNGDRLHQAVRRIRFRETYTLDSFAVSSSNEMAYAAARAVASHPGEAYNPLFLYGGVGVGKTHLMQGVGQIILARNPATKIIYCSGEEFTNEIIEAIRHKNTSGFRKRYRTVVLLLIDDIQFIAGKTAVQEEFFHTFNAITKEGGQIILTSDKPPKEIDSLEDRLRSRFEGGLAIDIGRPDFELRCAIVMIKAKEVGVNLPAEVVQYLAESETDTRALLGKLTTLVTMANDKKVPISLKLAAGVVSQKSTPGKNRIDPIMLIDCVAGFYQQQREAVVGTGRLKEYTLPRHVAMYLLKQELNMGLVEIGRQFSGRDHTSVMHALKKIEFLLKTDSVFDQQFRVLKNNLYKQV